MLRYYLGGNKNVLIKKNRNTKGKYEKLQEEILKETKDISLTELKIAFGNIIKRTSTK